MKNRMLSVVGLVVICACVGCKGGNGIDVLVDVNPFKNPFGGLRFQPVPDEAPRVAKNTGVEVRFNLKRDGGSIGKEDISIDVRIPGEVPTQSRQPAENEKKVEDLPAPLPVPALLTAKS